MKKTTPAEKHRTSRTSDGPRRPGHGPGLYLFDTNNNQQGKKKNVSVCCVWQAAAMTNTNLKLTSNTQDPEEMTSALF